MSRSTSKNKSKRKAAVKTQEADFDDCASDITQLSIEEHEDDKSGDSNTNGDIVPSAFLTEEKVKEALENATHKNVSIRIEALKILQSIFSSHYLPGLLDNWKVTAADTVERCLKKRTGEECKRAVNLGALLALQLSSDFGPSVTNYQTILKEWGADWTLNSEFRAECTSALSLYVYLAVEELEEIANALNVFHEIWVRAKANSPIEFSILYCASLNAWTLLLLRLPNRYLENALKNDLPLLCDHLENGQMEVRICSGETLCVLYELANELPAYAEEGFRPASMPHTLAILEQMSHDSVKYQAKRDRRLQRSTFRDIYAALKDDEAPEIKVKFGLEMMVLDSWSLKLCYDAMCSILRGGLNNHLQENLILRNTFGLGAPISNPTTGKASKLERQILNHTINKTRSLARGKQRDKRTAIFN